MEGLVHRFALDVHFHIVSSVNSDTEVVDGIHHLVHLLNITSPPHLVDIILETLCHDLIKNSEIIRSNNGIQRLMLYMIHTDPAYIHLHIIDNACRVLTLASAECMCTLLRDIHPDLYSRAIPMLLNWHLKSGSGIHVFMFCNILSSDSVTIYELIKEDPIDMMCQFTKGFDLPTPIVLLGVDTLIAVLAVGANSIGCWNTLGFYFMDHLASLDVCPRFVSTFAQLIGYLGEEQTLTIPLWSPIFSKFCHALLTTNCIASMIAILKHKGMNEKLLYNVEFVHSLFACLCDWFITLTASIRHTTLDYLLVGVANYRECPPPRLNDIYYNIQDQETIIKRGTLLALGTTTANIATHFKSLIRDNNNTPDNLELDAELCTHFETLITNQEWSVQCIQLHGCVIGGALFHAITTIVGRHLSKVGTRVNRHIRSFLEDCIHTSRKNNNTTWGLERYSNELERRYFLNCTSKVLYSPLYLRMHTFTKLGNLITICPITLETMHCPVVACDGNTYELSAIIMLKKNETDFLSPLTRIPLHPFVFYNRALHESEVSLWKSSQCFDSGTTLDSL